MEEYGSNSNRSKELAAKGAEKKVEKVITGNAHVKKKSEIRKILDIFTPTDTASVKSYIVHDIVIPSIKNAISSVVDILLFGEVRRGSKKNGRGGSRASYASYYESDRDRDQRDYRPYRQRDAAGFDVIVYESRGDAERVLDSMFEYLDQYHIIDVAAMYDFSNVTDIPPAANRYGWTDLSGSTVYRQRDGSYVIDIPRRPMPID